MLLQNIFHFHAHSTLAIRMSVVTLKWNDEHDNERFWSMNLIAKIHKNSNTNKCNNTTTYETHSGDNNDKKIRGRKI